MRFGTKPVGMLVTTGAVMAAALVNGPATSATPPPCDVYGGSTSNLDAATA
ncbi:hypothetical protein [Nonomuraea sp. NPDC049141]|uniref:hypothetical protein n=1 Tax=Nonomuraea sp. NPDC049141 TaxID=3155500 RepID=UPI0033F2D33C